MSRMLLIWCCCCLLFVSVSAKDSLSKKRTFLPRTYTYCSNLSVSYISYKNWKYNGFNSLFFQIRENMNYDSIGPKLETHLRINTELAYLKFIDSIWQKNNDLLDISLEILNAKKKKLTNSLTFNLNTQFVSDRETYFSDQGEELQRWCAGFGNPMTIDLCYGSAIKLWKNSRLTLNYASIHTTITPRLNNAVPSDEKILLTKHSFINSEYGFLLQASIRQPLSKWLRWENNSRFFANGINAKSADFDIKNKLVFRLVKHLDLIIDTKLKYQPAEPFRIQLRNELMLAFTWEKI